MAREVSWMRQRRAARAIAAVFMTPNEAREIVNGMDFLGFEKVTGPPLYDNGDFVVIDTVKDLSFSVMRVGEDGSLSLIREVSLDKYEAIKVADEFKEAQKSCTTDL